MSSSSTMKRKDIWTNDERHYCKLCNAWMGSDRQSIMLHENGKKHRANVEKDVAKRRKEKQQEEKSLKFLQNSLKQMEQAASVHIPFSAQPQHPTALPIPSSSQPEPVVSRVKQEKPVRRRKREDQTEKKEESDEASTSLSKKRRTLLPGEGHYDLDGRTYLEGSVFDLLLEEEMPIQYWTGPSTSTLQERRLPQYQHYWTNAIVAAVSRAKTQTATTVVHVSYLLDTSEEEQLERNVDLGRIRIQLGGDKSIPDTLEEARLMAVGGEEIIAVDNQANSMVKGEEEEDQEEKEKRAALEEATGFSGWSTTTIKRTTVRQEEKQQREIVRQRRREEESKKASLQKDIEARRMEALQTESLLADDSALGAHGKSLFGGGSTETGYRGVSLADADENNLTVMETSGKSLAAPGGGFSFKKRKKAPKGNRRTTTSEDL